MKKNILFITDVDLSNPIKGTPLRMLNLARQLNKKHNLLICSRGIGDDFKDKFYPYPSGNFIKKLWFFVKMVGKRNINVIFANTDIEIRPAVFIKLFTGVKIVIDLHGLYSEELYYENLVSNFKRFLIDRVVKFLLSFYDLVFAVSDNLKDYYGRCNKKIEVLYNGVNPDDFYPQKDLRPDTFTVGYSGNMKSYQGFEHLLQSLKNIKVNNLFRFKLNLVISSGAAEIENILKKYNLFDETEVFNKIDHSKINEIINCSSVLVVPRPSINVTEYAYPSKLPEYMMTGVPVITTDVGPVRKIFGDADCCIIIGHDHIAHSLEEALLRVFSMSRRERDLLGERAVNYVNNKLTWDILGEKLNQQILNL